MEEEHTRVVNPGSITDAANKDRLLHIVGYFYGSSGAGNQLVGKRGVYMNGTHYPQNDGSPGYTNTINDFTVGNHPGSNESAHHSIGIRIYSFRVWHELLTQEKVTALYNNGPSGSVLPIRAGAGAGARAGARAGAGAYY